MRKKFLWILLLCIIFLFCSCKGEQEQKKAGKVTGVLSPTATPQAVLEDFSHIEKHVVWYHDGQLTSGRDSRIFTRFNSLLLERGYDFVVDFVTEPALTEEQCRAYQQKLRDYKEQGQQVDLIFTGWAAGDEMTYDDAIRDGLLTPLDEFFTESEEGKKLYDAFPESVWEMMRREGAVYGVCEDGWHGDYYSATLNRELLEKYDVEPLAEFSFEGYFQTIQQVYEKAKSKGEILFPLYLEEEVVYAYLGYYKLGDFWVKNTEGELTFVNPYEDKEARKMFTLLNEYRDVFGGYGTYEEWWQTIKEGKQIASFIATLMYRSCNDSNNDYPAYTYEPHQMFYSMPKHNIVHGVSSWATYPEEAKTLLTLISTDEEFINLLFFGVEGVNYRMKDGKAELINQEKRETPRTEACVNDFFVYPWFAEPLNKKELLQKHQEEVVFLPLEAENLLKEPLSEEEEKVAELFRKAEGLWLGEYENAEAVAEQICEELQAANVEEVLRKRTEKIY